VEDAPHGVTEAHEALERRKVSARSGHQSLVLLAQKYIDAHYRTPSLALEEVAASMQISPG